MASTYMRQCQWIVSEYRSLGLPWPTSSRTIAEWAVTHKKWAMRPSDIFARCADDLSKAMREEYLIDPQGRTIRVKHAAKRHVNGETIMLWDDIRTASREHMAISAQQRREQIVGDCCQLKADVDSFNQNRKPETPIQVVFDFTRDVLEREAGSGEAA